jgi:hypothetical protein
MITVDCLTADGFIGQRSCMRKALRRFPLRLCAFGRLPHIRVPFKL